MISTAFFRIQKSAAQRLLSQHVGRSASIRMGGLRTFSSSDDLPYHLVVGMPALSPTMEAGVIATWNVKEGESFSAGDSIAEIETDKATMAFEAQDDGIVAKILVEAGPEDVQVNSPIMITVEEEEDVAAFADYVHTAEEVESTPEPEPVVEATPPVVAAAPALEPEPVAAPPAPPVVEAVAPVVEEAPTVVVASQPTTLAPIWGQMAKSSSPIIKLMSASQKSYVDKYGSTGQAPL